MNVLVLGATGQDGSFACELLTRSGHSVTGAVRKSATNNLSNLSGLLGKSESISFGLSRFDLQDESSIYRLLIEAKPDIIFNYADQDHVSWSHSLPLYSQDVTSRAVAVICEAMRLVRPEAILVQPISSNIFGDNDAVYMNESSAISPLSPYAISKANALFISRYYRSAHSLKVVNPIYFNHESERRTVDYVTRKITLAAARIKLGLQESIELGDISAKIDWGYAPEYVQASIDLAQQGLCGAFIIGSGELTSVEEFAVAAFESLDLDFFQYYKINPKFMRPTTNKPLAADTTKISEAIGFRAKVFGAGLARFMAGYDYENLGGV